MEKKKIFLAQVKQPNFVYFLFPFIKNSRIPMTRTKVLKEM